MRIATILILLFSGPAAFAQTTRPSFAPAPLVPGSDDTSGSAVLQPQIFPLDPSVDGDYVPPATYPSNFFREGVYLIKRNGTLTRGSDGTLTFAPDVVGQLADGATEPTLTILPGRGKTALEQQLGAAGNAQLRLSLTGLVTLYNMQNGLLVQVAGPEQQVDVPQLAADTGLPIKQAPATRPNPATMAAADVLDQLLTPTPATARPYQAANLPSIDAATGSGVAVAPNAAALKIRREGSFITDRLGRIERTADGQNWQFMFEADGQAMRDPPMMILPNLKMMTMEQAYKGSSRDLQFRVTGMVTEYNGRNYLLLEKVVVPPDTTTRF